MLETAFSSVNLKGLKVKRKASDRTLLLERLMADLGFSESDFKRLFGQTCKLTLKEITEMWESARRWKKNPKALFWKLVNEKNAQIKKDLSTV